MGPRPLATPADAAGPALDPGAKLTPDEQRAIAHEARDAGIGNAEAKVIIAAAFGAGRLAEVTGAAASKAAAAEGLDLPAGAGLREVVGAVIRSHSAAGGGGDGGAPDGGAPPAGGDGPNGGAAGPADAGAAAGPPARGRKRRAADRSGASMIAVTSSRDT